MGTMSAGSLETLAEWIRRRMEMDATPGLSMAVVDRDGVVHAAGFGLADVAAGIPVTPAHLFETGSIGKSFTAVALLQLADKGRIDVQAPVTDYLPWFSIASEYGPIRLHHLLSHTAGITAGTDFAPAGAIQVWNLRESVAATPPGTYFHYSNLGYKVLGEVLRTVTGERYGPTIQRRILDPLGLTDSAPTITSEIRHRLGVGYAPLYDDRPWWSGQPLAPATWLETDTADGCLAMTATDLATYLRMLLGRGSVDGTSVLSESGFDRLTQREIATDEPPEDTRYGYGIETTIVDGRTRIGHGGGMVGYFSGMIGDVESGIGVVALVNGPGAPNLIARTTLDYVTSLREGTPFAFPELDDPAAIEGAEAYAGAYVAVEGRDGPERFRIAADGSGLALVASGAEARLCSFEADVLLTDAAPLARFPLRFGREGGDIESATYGDTFYVRDGEPTPAPVDSPAEWDGFVGHYRSHNPWTSSLRVSLRRGRLWLSIPSEPDGLEAEQPLVALEDGWFRAGEDARIPERIRFDTVIEGKTHRADLSGCDFYRVGTP